MYKENNAEEQARPNTDLFGISSEQPIVDEETMEDDYLEEPEEESQPEPEAEEKPKEGKLSPEEAYRRVQSRADKAEAEARKERQQREEMEALVQYLAQQGVKPKEDSAEAEAKLEAPRKPQKPKGYSRYEAYNDENSESAKYLEEVEEYNERLADYLATKNERLEQQYLADKQRAQMEAQQAQQLRGLATTLMSQHGFTDNEVNDFIMEMSNPQPELDDLVALYRSKKQPKQKAPSPQSKQEMLDKAEAYRQRVKYPAPAGTGAGYKEAPYDDAKGFNESLGRQRDFSAIFSVKK